MLPFLEHTAPDPSYETASITAAWSEVSTPWPASNMGKPLIHAFISTLTGQMALAPDSPFLVRTNNLILKDYVAFAYSDSLKHIRDKLKSNSSTECLRHHIEPAELALDLRRQLTEGQPDSLGLLHGPSDETRIWFRSVMEMCHNDNKHANDLGIQLMVKLFRNGGNHARFYGDFLQIACERIFFTTSEGHMGFGPPPLKARDIICVMLGGPTPYALRPTDSDKFLFLGECFLYGFMYGEAITKRKAGDIELRDFIIS
jgi:hypothetical protein